MSYVELLAFEHASAASDQLNAAVVAALRLSVVEDLALFGFGTGVGIAIGWWIGDLVRWACRWYWERRS
ncbi:hypothetical protein [uncultured Hydrogenophaga sp.]|uniref:hypothetical protein n=1 Tax=uncultured Hydrogenophaga sp. TaxID=199683 RepID=UPI00258C6271|nr:hypothetical protein [uncultured Hydrogenophaga sp.]